MSEATRQNLKQMQVESVGIYRINGKIIAFLHFNNEDEKLLKTIKKNVEEYLRCEETKIDIVIG